MTTFRTPSGKFVWLALPLLALTLLATACGGGAAVENVTLLDDTLSGTRLELDTGSANVEVVAAEGDEIGVQAIQETGREGDFAVTLGKQGDTVRVTERVGRCFFNCERSLRYIISLPADVAADIQVGSGTLRVEGVTAALTLQTGSGDIELEDLGGTLNARSGSGGVTLRGSQTTETRIETSSGNVSIERVSGPLSLKTSSGSIEISEADAAQLDVQLSSGNLEFEGTLAEGSSNEIDSSSGNVTLRLPDDSQFQLAAETSSGTVRSDFALDNEQGSDNAVRGTVGEGTTTLNIEASSGNITIEQQ